MKINPLLHYINVFLIICSVSLYSCFTPDPLVDLSPEEKDIYVTNRDKSANFSNYKTYFLDDTVRVVTKESGATSDSVSTAPLILSTIDSELQKIGFQKVTTPQSADVGISVSVLKFSEEVPVSYYPYAGGAGYAGYASPAVYGLSGYGYGFPPYYGYYEIEIGSISIEMFDLNAARSSSDSTLNVIWSAVLAGSIAEGTTSGGGARIKKSISAAFEQSPYLKDGK